MLLEQLAEYADRLEDMPPMNYVKAPVRYVIHLKHNGDFIQMEDTADKDNKNGRPSLVPKVVRSVSVKPLLLADNIEYTLGVPKDKDKADSSRVGNCHKAYIELVQLCATKTGELSVLTVLKFLQNNPAEAILKYLQTDPSEEVSLQERLDGNATFIFAVELEYPTTLPAVQEFWAEYNNPSAINNQMVMECLVCGKEKPVLERLQGNIKGVLGGQTSGTAIISANSPAFESYGLSASLIAPTCAVCAEKFTKALNALIAGKDSHFYLGNSTFVFWTHEISEFSLHDEIDKPTLESVKALREYAQLGKKTPTDETAFYAVSLSASGARTVVRDWIDTTIGTVKLRLHNFYNRCQQIVDVNGSAWQPLSIVRLAGATVRELKDLNATVPRALLHSALTGAPLPKDLLFRAVTRCRAERKVTYARAALIKMVLVSHSDPNSTQEDYMVQLDPNHPSPAYHCGRLLYTLEDAQRHAIPNINATLVDRFYGAASAAPASVFGQLLKNLQAHLSKLERDKKGPYRRLQTQLEEILGRIKSFPRTLTLEEQGLFALGYYHQRAYNRAQAVEKAERKKSRKIEDEDPAE